MITIIVPCYNEEEVLPCFYEEARKVLEALGRKYEILFVNDGSKDGTLRVIKEFAEKDEHIRYLSFSRNFGKESAMYAGFVNAAGDYVAIMDADLQDPPSLLPQMLDIIENQGYDSVATRRENRIGEPPVRSAFAKIFYRIINRISDADVVDGARDFRLMKRSMVEAILSMTENNRFTKGIMGWIGFKTYWLPYENIERAAGTTKWSFWGLLKYALDGIFNFSHVPLHISSLFGFSMTVLSLILTVYIFAKRLLYGNPVQGWASMSCLILFSSGIQLFCIGIVGEYIAKIYTEVKSRPHFIVSETNKADAVKIR